VVIDDLLTCKPSEDFAGDVGAVYGGEQFVIEGVTYQLLEFIEGTQ
jgi:hypothetical protein